MVGVLTRYKLHRHSELILVTQSTNSCPNELVKKEVWNPPTKISINAGYKCVSLLSMADGESVYYQLWGWTFLLATDGGCEGSWINLAGLTQIKISYNLTMQTWNLCNSWGVGCVQRTLTFRAKKQKPNVRTDWRVLGQKQSLHLCLFSAICSKFHATNFVNQVCVIYWKGSTPSFQSQTDRLGNPAAF